MNLLRQLSDKIGARRLALMGAVATALLVALAWVALPGGSGPMGYLYTDLDPSSAQAIADKLQADGVPFQISADGSAVMAPQDRLADLRMAMAGDRLGGKIGYEVLDGEQPFGLSASREKINQTRAIEGELSRSIESLQNVTRARVHIVMPERELFASAPRGATAAVTVKTLGRLPGENVQAIRHLVAAAVPDLSPDKVSVIDQTGALLARAGESGAGASGDADERQQAVETRLRQQIESLLEPIVGMGKVRAEVAAVIDRDQTREEASVVDPDKQAISKQVTVESTGEDNEQAGGAGAATVSAQLPEGQQVSGGEGGERRRSAKNETSEDVTYDNSRTNTVRVRPPGEIKRLTVAVMVDGGAQPMPAPQVQRLQRLVENAVGFDQERGDSVVVESMKFTAADAGAEDEGFLSNLPTDPILSIVKMLIIAGVALIALRMLKPASRAGDTAIPLLASPGGPEVLAVAGPVDAAQAIADPARLSAIDQEIALAEVDGRIKLSAIKRVGDTVAASPAEAASVIRTWMTN